MKKNDYSETTRSGDHVVATANGCCVPSCPACLAHDGEGRLYLWLGLAILVCGLLGSHLCP
jgi:hypothetical protein